MAIAQADPPLKLLTYEQYMAEGEINKRYDILDGVREYMSDPTREHQRIVTKLIRRFGDYEDTSGQGQVIVAPSDVLITVQPLRTRQPDVLFISHARLAQNPPAHDTNPLHPAPELVVEIISSSDTRAVLAGKLADYCRVNVLECWVGYPNTHTVDVLSLTPSGSTPAATYGAGEIVQSVVFPGLDVAVDDIFAG